MNVAMDCAALDLRKSKHVSLKYTPPTPPPPAPYQPYSPLTPPSPYSTAAPAPYQTLLPISVMESSASDSDVTSLSSSPPGHHHVTSTYLLANPVTGRNGRPTRPFKAYPKDPLTLSTTPSVILGHDSTEEYMEFRQRMMAQLELVSGRNNSNMKRSISPQMPSSTADMDDKTVAYWERRRKNNEAAKRSRDARRAKEDEIAIRAAFLEQENIKLKYELASLRNETAKLRCLVYNR